MKKFEKVHRLQADSVAEIAGEFVEATARVGRSVRFGRRKVQPGPLLNALALWFLRLPDAERVALAAALVADLEVLLAETAEEREAAEARRMLAGGSPPPVHWHNPRDVTEGDKRRERERKQEQEQTGSDADPDGDHERAEGDCEPRRV